MDTPRVERLHREELSPAQEANRASRGSNMNTLLTSLKLLNVIRGGEGLHLIRCR